MKKITKLFFVGILCLASLVCVLVFAKTANKVNAGVLSDGETLDTTYDEISVSDLTFDGLSGQSMIVENKNFNSTFTRSDENGSLVFKFKYEVNNDSNSDSVALRVHFDVADDQWNSNAALWMRGDGVYLSKWTGEKFDWTKRDALTKGTHTIEFGMLAVIGSDSKPTGNYYLYYKVDGTLGNERSNPYDVSKMDGSMFFNFSAANTTNKVYDANLSYEEPQYVSVSDLKNGGTGVGQSVTERKFYTYDTAKQPTNKSTAFVAKIDYTTAEDSQIYIASDSWKAAGYMWMHPSKCYFGITDSTGAKVSDKEVKYSSSLVAGNQYQIEYGRLAVMNGSTFTGKYHVYFKIDGNLIYAIDQVIEDVAANAGGIQITGNGNFAYLDAYTKENAKVVDMCDLTSAKDTLITEHTDLSYDNTNHSANYSLIFRFNYTANVLGNNQVHLSSAAKKWDSTSSIILNNNNGTTVHLGKTKADGTADGWQNITLDTPFVQGQTYNVEYGRLANMLGNKFLGTYYCYLKIDGVVVASGNYVIEVDVLQGNAVFITADGQNTFSDIAPADVYETADIISVSSLKSNNELVGNTTVMNDTLYYTYEAKAANKSFIYKVKYTVDEVKSGDSGYFQLCFGQSWTANNIWVRADKTFLKKDGNGYVQSSSKAFTEAKTYNLEFGKIYVAEGKHVGMYYLYLKVDGALQVEYLTANDYNNNALFNNKSGATQVWTDICADGHTLGTQVSGQASTCQTHGTLSYYECSACGKKFADAEGTQVLTSLVAPLGEHSVEGGVCTVCGASSNPEFTTTKDEDGIELTTPINLWKYTDAVIEFDSSYSSITIDLVSPIKTGRISEKKALNGTEVNGIDGVYYHYSFTVKDLATNNATGYETVNVMRFRCAGDYANFAVTGYVDPFETADEISVKDLFYLSGKAVGKVATFNTTGGLKFQYNTTSEHKSVIFSFKFGITEIPSKTDYSYGQFHFLDNWSSNCLWPRNDKTFIKKDGDGYAEGSKIFTEAGEKIITYGKVYIKSGDLAGKYYLFIKADGVLIDQFVTANDYNNNKMFCTLDDGNKWYDLSYVPDTYEEADVISVGDLSYNGQQNCNIMTLDAHKMYSYTATAEHKSVIFKYSMTVSEIPEKSDYDYGQIHFTDGWSSNCLWIRGDNTFIQKDADGYASAAKLFSEAGTKIIEIGKLYIVSGENAGKYYLYIKADGVLVLDYVTANLYEKNFIFFTGNDGRKLYSFDFVECTETHTLVKNDAVAETCDTDGNIEYYWCSNCGKLFSDAQGTTEATTIVISKHHTLGTLVAAVAETCDTDGTLAYYECTDCHKYFADAEATQELTNLVVTKHHTIVHHEAVQESCYTLGNIEYYECTACHKNFADTTYTTEVGNYVIGKHHTLTKVEAVEADCKNAGSIAYYHCSICGNDFLYENGSMQIDVETDIAVPAHHTLTKVEAVAPTCLEGGFIEYYHCSECGKNFDAEGTQIAELEVEATGHNFEKGACTVCGAEDPNYSFGNKVKDLPGETVESIKGLVPESLMAGCQSSLSITGVIFALGIAGIVLKKKREEE